MSIPVDPKDLAGALAEHPFGYLMTVSPDGRVKAVTVEPTATASELVVHGVSRGSARNIAENPQVTMVFPPRQLHGFTLIVDGAASVTAEEIRVAPQAAVLHRPAAHADGPLPPAASADACGNDCRPVAARESAGDYEYDLAHEATGTSPQRPGTGPIFPAHRSGHGATGDLSDDLSYDLSYDLAHDVPHGS